jgi:hypothetical protein
MSCPTHDLLGRLSVGQRQNLSLFDAHFDLLRLSEILQRIAYPSPKPHTPLVQ